MDVCATDGLLNCKVQGYWGDSGPAKSSVFSSPISVSSPDENSANKEGQDLWTVFLSINNYIWIILLFTTKPYNNSL